MASIATLLVVAFLCGAALAQNVPPVNWATVGPIHRTPGFFDDYPVLRQIYDRQNPLTSSLEGNSTLRNQFPYQVALVLTRRGALGYCGASLLSNLWILTAAHCIDIVATGTAFLGAHNVRDGNEVGQLRVTVTQFRPHPGFNGLRLTDDVGLVQLPSPIQYNNNIAPIRLSNYRQVASTYDQQQATLTGWGRSLSAPPLIPSTIRQVNLRVITLASCRLRTPNTELDMSMLCADPFGERFCPGDAGGALTVIEADGMPTQVGVTSFITGLGCSSRPAVFTRLNFYLRWIQQTTNITVSEDFVF